MRPRLPFALFALLSLAAAGMVGACSNQSEGEPCNVNSDDCASNLACVQTPNSNGYRCCPATNPTTVVCALNNSGVSGGNPAPADGGASGETGSTSPDSGPDSEADSSSADSADGASE